MVRYACKNANKLNTLIYLASKTYFFVTVMTLVSLDKKYKIKQWKYFQNFFFGLMFFKIFPNFRSKTFSLPFYALWLSLLPFFSHEIYYFVFIIISKHIFISKIRILKFFPINRVCFHCANNLANWQLKFIIFRC